MSDDLEALEPITLPLVKGSHYVHPYFAEQQNPILHYWQILRKRKWVILATVAIVFALSVISTLNATRLYQATSKIAIFPENPNVLGFKDMADIPQWTINTTRLLKPKSRFCAAMLWLSK